MQRLRLTSREKRTPKGGQWELRSEKQPIRLIHLSKVEPNNLNDLLLARLP
jgi:hypothetical protein